MVLINNERIKKLNEELQEAHRQNDTTRVTLLSEEIAGALDEHIANIRGTVDNTRTIVKNEEVNTNKSRTDTYRDLIMLYRECNTLAKEISNIKKLLRQQKKGG